MLLSHLLQNVEHSEILRDVNITSIVSDSSKVTENCIFICIEGDSFDSHSIACEMINKGASAVIAEKETGAYNQVIVDDTKKALALMCSEFYGNPSKKLKLIGVTGTNGKTSTTFMIKEILESAGKKTGLLGTVSYMSGSGKTEAGLTTPEPLLLHKMFKSMVDNGCQYCVMEVSSQALSQQRCYGIEFECAVFTNLTVDHLDYHKTMENYLFAKSILFKQSKVSVINCDDNYSKYMASASNGKIVQFSTKNQNADYYADNINLTKVGCRYTIGDTTVDISIPGKFSVYNSLGAIACCESLGIPLEKSVLALSGFSGIPGRAEVIEADLPYTIIIDYAHSPDALANILVAVRDISDGRVVALFGCGGDRDKTKRPLMAKAATENADYVIITSDNPRSENPNDIIEDIIPGIKGSKTSCAIIPDRTYAIEYALKNAKPKDVIVLCGKGHETYQIIGNQKYYYDEREIIRNYLSK